MSRLFKRHRFLLHFNIVDLKSMKHFMTEGKLHAEIRLSKHSTGDVINPPPNVININSRFPVKGHSMGHSVNQPLKPYYKLMSDLLLFVLYL